MKVAAFGDAHLGRSYYPYTTPEGVNQRERDFEISFEAAVDTALSLDPDLVVWLGDIFDHPRPTYRSFRFAQRALVKLREYGKPVVVITGNHDTPRLPGMGSPYSVLADTFPEVHFAHRLAYERFELPGLVVHAVPQMMTVDATLAALDEADRSRSLDKSNLLLTHPRITQVQPRYADINEIEIDAGRLRSDLVLLGHYHSAKKVLDGIWYAGATDTFSFADDADPKGVVLLDTDSGEFRHVPIANQRPMVSLDPLDCLGHDPTSIEQRVIRLLESAPAGAVVRLALDGISPEAYRLLDLAMLREAGSHILHLKLEPDYARVEGRADLPDMDSMSARWHKYLGEEDLVGYDRDRITRLGDDYLSRAVEENV